MALIIVGKEKGSKGPKLIEKYKGGKIHQGVGGGNYYISSHPHAPYTDMGGHKSVEEARKEIDKHAPKKRTTSDGYLSIARENHKKGGSKLKKAIKEIKSYPYEKSSEGKVYREPKE